MSVTWITSSGSLGTIPEGVFYSTPVQATSDGGNVYFKLIAGELPEGIQITTSGTILGIPKNIVNIQGVPTEVSEDVTSKFAIRAYNDNGNIADRTFTLTISGQDTPDFVTPAGNIGTYYDSTEVSIQIEYTDTDPNDKIRISVVAGSLPPGLIINPSTGIISGIIAPLVGPAGTAPAGFSSTEYDQYPFDFSTRSASRNYQFVLEITDGKNSNLRSFEIYVYSKDSMSADTTDFTADNTWITADVVPTRTPVLLNKQGSIGTYRTDNFFAYKFDAIDFDGDAIQYITVSALPPTLALNIDTGWLWGYLEDQGATDLIYNFQVQVRKTNNPSIISEPYSYSINLIGNIETEVIWITPPDLGTIPNGSTSTLSVEAYNTGGRVLQYQLVEPGSRLPQGLSLYESGHIVGRVSFNTFALDGGSTTFDINLNSRLGIDETTFDQTYTFTVNAYSPATETVDGNAISVFRTFTVRVSREFNEPYQTLYIKAMPPEQDRALINQLIQNQDIIPVNLVYRPDDPNFGVAKNVIYDHAYGLAPASLDSYVESLNINHYWKNLVLGEIKTAQALDASGNILYEVVYSQIIDDLVNNDGVSVSKAVNLPYPVDTPDSTEIITVYPNSLVDMRTQVIDTVGQISPALPLWMTSKQTNGRVLGFVPAWVIAYARPGQSGRIAYNIREQFGEQLNKVDFKVDRYEIDRSMTHNWETWEDSTSSGRWIPYPPAATTFDIQAHYQLPEPNDSSFAFNGGSGYAVGDRIKIFGSQIGGVDEVNDLILTVNTVDPDNLNAIVSVFYQGIAPTINLGEIYYNIAGTNISGTGTGATWDLIVVGANPTVFDGGSTTFINVADRWTNTDTFDKYLVFPRTNILG